MDETMDNQQESLLWWLGGIIDGEGCITINHNRLHRGTKKETLLFSPIIVITNTNKVMIEKCQEIFQFSNIPFYIQYKEKAEGRRVPCWWIKIQGIKRCIRALNILSRYLFAKKEEANLVKRFCELRLQYPQNGRIYTDEEFEIIMRVAEVHNRNPQRLYAEIRNYKEIVRPKIIRNRSGQFEVAK